MIEMVLLGFLMDGEKTGYEIKKYMENSTTHYSLLRSAPQRIVLWTGLIVCMTG